MYFQKSTMHLFRHSAHCFLAVVFCLVLSLQVPVSAHAATPPVQVTSVTDLGILTSTPNNIIARDVAATGLLGGQVLWVFGDTFINNPPPNETPADWRSSTQAHSSPSNPFSLLNLEDSNGLPYQLIPYTQAELDYNIQQNNPGGNRIALWPEAVLSTDQYDAEIVYMKVHVLGTLNYQILGTGVAHIAIFQNQATRDFSIDPTSGLTFQGNILPFGTSGGLLAQGTVDDMVYLYTCTNALSNNCYVARVSAPHGSTDATWEPLLVNPANYQTWNGSTWVSDLSQAQPMTNLQASAVGWSVAWNPYVRNPETGGQGAYIGLYNQIVPYGSGALPTNNVMLVVAANPWGPWSDPIQAFTTTPESGQFDYAVQLHAELTSSDGTTIFATYAHPAPSKCAFCEDVKVVQMTLQNT